MTVTAIETNAIAVRTDIEVVATIVVEEMTAAQAVGITVAQGAETAAQGAGTVDQEAGIVVP